MFTVKNVNGYHVEIAHRDGITFTVVVLETAAGLATKIHNVYLKPDLYKIVSTMAQAAFREAAIKQKV